MKTTLRWTCAALLTWVAWTCPVQAVSFPLPVYFLTETCSGLVTDIPGAEIESIGSRRWSVTLPAGQFWYMDIVHLREPGTGACYNTIAADPRAPGRLLWVSNLGPTPGERTFALVYRDFGSVAGPLGSVLFTDQSNHIPDRTSTVSLLGVALLGMAGAHRCLRLRVG